MERRLDPTNLDKCTKTLELAFTSAMILVLGEDRHLLM